VGKASSLFVITADWKPASCPWTGNGHGVAAGSEEWGVADSHNREDESWMPLAKVKKPHPKCYIPEEFTYTMSERVKL
jgi:hypothetical protein